MLQYGYIKFNTRYIPTFIKKQEVTNKNSVYGFIHVKSESPVLLEFENNKKYTLESGEHFLPRFHTFQTLKILSECEVYECVCDPKYFDVFLFLTSYNIVVDTLKPINGNDDHVMFHNGVCMTISHDKLIDACVCDDYLTWLKLYDTYIYKDPTNYEYSVCIKHEDVDKIQEDEEVKQYRAKPYKDYIMYSSPPCIGITYKDTNYEALSEVLLRKYNYNLYKPSKPNTMQRLNSNEDICSQIVKRNEELQKYPHIFEFKCVQSSSYINIKLSIADGLIPMDDLKKIK